MGYSQAYDSSAALLFDVPGSNLPLVVQERQIGGTRSRFQAKHALGLDPGLGTGSRGENASKRKRRLTP
jgi:hypothetical protein